MIFQSIPSVPMSLGNLQDEMNRLFARVWHGGISTPPFDGQEYAPHVDVYEYDDRYVLLVELPGVDAGAVEVCYLANTITVRGEKSKPADADEARRIRRERRFGRFMRTIELPGEIDPERLAAKCHAGILEITVQRTETSRAKSVKINVGDV